MRSNEEMRQFGVVLPVHQYQQLHLEAARSGRALKVIVAAALEAYLPKVKVTVIKPGRSRASIAQEA